MDHGKSTLADRLLEVTSTVLLRDMRDQVLDTLELERERGITIKLVPVQMKYRGRDGLDYILNLIDTPGHVDFSYEVSRSLAACEGALLVVDAAQGVEAQTVANAYLAADQGLDIVPVINKIDLPSAQPELAARELEEVVGVDASRAVLTSAKEGKGIQEVLEAVIERISPPKGDPALPLQALIFDSKYNNFRGVICSIRVTNGVIRTGDMITFMVTQKNFQVEEIGVFCPQMCPVDELGPGEVGYLIANVKTVDEARVGDTVTSQRLPARFPLPGYRQVKPVVFCGFYPIERDEYTQLREALEKLQMNDSAIFFEPETSIALGFGFRCGFLGLLHMEIARERLNREFGVDLVSTAPNVVYQVIDTKGSILEAHRPSDFPETIYIDEVREPFIKVTAFVPSEYVGKIMQLCQDRRGVFIGMDYITPLRARIVYELPLAEFIIDFHDRLKSATRGFASIDYEHAGFRASDLVKVDLLIGGDAVDAFCFVCHSDRAFHRGQEVVRKLKELIPRQMFEVSIQAAIGKRVIVRQNVKPLRKDVLAKCYGGDITRKRKLLEKQKEGKKRMKQIGKISLPQEAFLAFLKSGDEEEE